MKNSGKYIVSLTLTYTKSNSKEMYKSSNAFHKVYFSVVHNAHHKHNYARKKKTHTYTIKKIIHKNITQFRVINHSLTMWH